MEKKDEDEEGVEYLIVKRIDAKLLENGLSRSELTAKIKKKKGKFANNTLPNWSTRKTIPTADIAIEIADALQCSVRWLITGENDVQEEYSIEEKNLIFKFRSLDRQGRHEVKTLLNVKINPIDNDLDMIAAVEKKGVS